MKLIKANLPKGWTISYNHTVPLATDEVGDKTIARLINPQGRRFFGETTSGSCKHPTTEVGKHVALGRAMKRAGLRAHKPGVTLAHPELTAFCKLQRVLEGRSFDSNFNMGARGAYRSASALLLSVIRSHT